MTKAKRWTEAEKDFLRESYKKISYDEIAVALGKTTEQVKCAAGRYKITQSRAYTAEELAVVAELYPTTETAVLEQRLGRTRLSIYNMAFKLRLKKDPALIREMGQKHAQHPRSIAKRFPKGNVPMNKGLRRPGWSPGNMSKTQFKKGSFSPNRREIGEERVSRDGYIYVKIADGQKNRNWRQKHWVVWEHHYGPVPDGMNVVFKDGNKQNCDIENLESITDAQLMSRNTFHNYPEPIKKQIHVLAGFKRRLNKYAKKQNRRSEKSSV